jgi:hypothetical protein
VLRPAAATIRSCTAASFSAERPVASTSCRCFVSSTAAAAPIPALAPVTTIVPT